MALRNTTYGEAVPMEPGERTRRVVIQQMTKSQGPSKRPVESWTTLTTAWMRRMDISPLGRQGERFTASQLVASVDTQWEMGYRVDMDPELVDVPTFRRISYLGRFFDIVSASVIGRKEGIELLTLARSGS